MRLVKAEEVTLRKSKMCATCDALIGTHEVAWREMWHDDGHMHTEHYHLHCDSEDETREEYFEELAWSR